MTKRAWVIGNWKMYKTAREATDYIERLLPCIEGADVQVGLAVPYTSISPASQFARDSSLLIGAQNMNDAREGAFTGEIAGLMLKEAGASFVLLGHSERRHVFGETDDMIQKKVIRALQDGLRPVLCVGETWAEHKEGLCEEVLRRQIETGLAQVSKEEAKNILLAYEPVWAIGTGQAASPEKAGQAHAFCRKMLGEVFGKKGSATIPILYGGSVKPDNVSKLMQQEEIDGVLVGGASLDAETLGQIVQNCRAKTPLKKTVRKSVTKRKTS